MRVVPGVFDTVVGALPIELLGNMSTMGYLINIKIEDMLYELWGNFYIEFHGIFQQGFGYIIFFILSGDKLYKSLL